MQDRPNSGVAQDFSGGENGWFVRKVLFLGHERVGQWLCRRYTYLGNPPLDALGLVRGLIKLDKGFGLREILPNRFLNSKLR